jgi:DNA-binding NarL/FixJ family response regulator
MKIKIVLADDHQFLLEGIAAVIKEMEELQIMATVQNGLELMTAIAMHYPDLVVLDLNMPGLDGMQCLQKIKAEYPSIKVLILTNYNQPELIEMVKKMQADGFLLKNSTATELKTAIKTILLGEKHYPTSKSDTKSNVSFFFDDFLKKYHLTKREVEIIRMICRGMTTKQIATSLFLSELTINTHRRNILQKLEVKNVAGIMNFAKENQLL